MKRIFALIFTILFTLTITACSATSANETTFEKAKREGAVTVGFANEKPYAYLTPDGQLTGEAVEVARAVLKRLGINQMHGGAYGIRITLSRAAGKTFRYDYGRNVHYTAALQTSRICQSGIPHR